MWHIILNTESNEYIVLSTEDGIIHNLLIDVDKIVWVRNLLNFVGIIPDEYPEVLDKWLYDDNRLRLIFSFESNDPITFLQSIHITHPEIFI